MAESPLRKYEFEDQFIEIVEAPDDIEAGRRVSAIGDDVRVVIVRVTSSFKGNGKFLTETVGDLKIPVLLWLGADKGEFPLACVDAFDLCFAAETTEIVTDEETVPAPEAERLGMINRSAPVDEAGSLAKRCARAIAGLAPLAVKRAKEAVRVGASCPLEEGLAVENMLFAELFSTFDMSEGTSAFLEKRSPVFRGE